MTVSVTGDSSDDDLDWEEVQVPEQQQEQFDIPFELQLSTPAPRQNIEIILQTRRTEDDVKKKAAAAAQAQRVLRTTCHKMHTVALLANARIRNKWINDPLLHARLLSVTPLALQNGFAMIHKSRVPDPNKRGRLFESAVERLVDWWCEFFTVTPTGHIRSRTFEEVEEEIGLANQSDGSETDNGGHEAIRSVESLMKHLLMQRGCRDTSAQLFTALCRALDVPARLVVSLQSVPWKSKVGKLVPKKDNSKRKGKLPQKPAYEHKGIETNGQSEIEDAVEMPSTRKGKGKGKETANSLINLRGRKSQSTSRSGSATIGARSLTSPVPTTSPPVFWTEVFSRADVRWLPVDPIRGIVNKRHVFDPTHPQNTASARAPVRQDNRMLYVIGLEEDGFGRDITARYAHDYTAKISKAQAVGAGPISGRREWWARVVQSIMRPYRLQRDDLEDDELHTHQLTEGMPTTISGFKNHLLYALSRHLRRDQVIDPPTELGKFRGEPVYPRSSVISLKTAENWMRQGRVIRQGCQPMKMVKQRAATVTKQREIEFALERAKVEGHAGGGEDVMQGLYAFSQTEQYKPEAIRDGKIPKNDFGNIDLYVPSMLPHGAVHIPFKGAAKIAKKLGFDYAEAVTGFEFRKRRAMPVIEGIVTAAENENVMVEACLEAEQEAEEKARAKQLERACKRWIRFVHGLRIRERLQKQYGSCETEEPDAALKGSVQESDQRPWLDTDENERPGGYLTTADDVVEPFYLPGDKHPTATTSTSHLSRSGGDAHPLSGGNSHVVPASVSPDQLHILSGDEDSDGDADNMDVDVSVEPPRLGVPKTMRELAEAQAAWPLEKGDWTPPLPEDEVQDEWDRNRIKDRTSSSARGARGTSQRGRRKDKGQGRRAISRTQTTVARVSSKRARSENEGSDVEAEQMEYNTPRKRCLLGSLASAPNPGASAQPASDRVLRPRRKEYNTTSGRM